MRTDFSDPNLNVNELTPEQIQELKNAYGQLYKAEVSEETFLVRAIYGYEYDDMRKMAADPNALNEQILQKGVVAPLPDYSKGGWSVKKAGIPESLIRIIKSKSGFLTIDGRNVDLDTDVVQLHDVTKPTMPDAAVLDEIKRNNPHAYLVLLYDIYVVVRPCLRSEWRKLTASDKENTDFALASTCTMWPENFDYSKGLAGWPETVSRLILNISGFDGPTKIEKL